MHCGGRGVRPLRSILFVPAANARAVEKAAGLACDAVILDLEDSALPSQKDAARARAAESPCGTAGRVRAIRVNAPGSPWFAEDIVAAAAKPDCAVVLPKVSSAGDLVRARAALAAAGGKNPLWAMIETPKAVLNLKDIAASTRETDCQTLIAGSNDLAAALRLPPNGGQMRAALAPCLAQIVLAARAYDLAALDGVYNDFTNAEGFIAEARAGRALGFDGKTLIHPSQVAAANEIFSPTEAELDWARRVIAAFAAPEAADKGAVRMGGEMLERMHLARAESMLALAAASRMK